jgi:hypothetical protein
MRRAHANFDDRSLAAAAREKRVGVTPLIFCWGSKEETTRPADGVRQHTGEVYAAGYSNAAWADVDEVSDAGFAPSHPGASSATATWQ